MDRVDCDVVIAGAGIVGMSTALWAQMAGLRVVLCDRNPPGSGASAGSACTIATYACLPINSPALIPALPRLMLSADSPLSIDVGHALRNLGWMTAFLRACRQSRVDEITAALARLLARADAGLNPLLAAAGAEDLLVANDCLYVWSTAAGYESARRGNAQRRAHGIAFDELSGAEVRALEPALQITPHRGLLFRGARHVLDPRALVTRFHQHYTRLGGTTVTAHVAGMAADATGVTLRLTDGQALRARHAVVAAGAHGGAIRGAGMEQVPLGVERGYHLAWADKAHLLTRPVGWAEAGLYATPMAEGLRFAGTVELAALSAPPNPRRLAYIRRRAEQMVGPLGPPSRDWLGFRPTLPDALPVIGPAPHNPRILHAFGHQHIGLTLGGMTGQLVTRLLQREAPGLDLTAFSASRFGR